MHTLIFFVHTRTVHLDSKSEVLQLADTMAWEKPQEGSSDHLEQLQQYGSQSVHKPPVVVNEQDRGRCFELPYSHSYGHGCQQCIQKIMHPKSGFVKCSQI